MLDHERATVVEKLLSGVTFFRYSSKVYKIVNPTKEIRALGDFLATEASQELNFSQLITKEELKQTLHLKGIWTFEEDERLKESEKTIEEICTELGADSLKYLKLEDINNIVLTKYYCTACFGGEYNKDILDLR